MKKLLFAAALIAGGAVLLQDLSSGHGGTYRGPGDTVPAGGGGGGGGGPSSPGSGGPSAPGGGGPSSPGPASPGAPGGGPGGSGGGPQSPGGGGDAGPDLTIWDYWWGFNREPYINLKSHIHSGAVVTGSDDFFLGRGEKQQARDSLRPSEATIRSTVVPALTEALNTERSNHIVTGAMIALAKIGDPKGEDGKEGFSQHIKKFLADGNQEIAETAGLALGILASEQPANLEILNALVNNKSAVLRSQHGVQITGNVSDRSRAFAAYGLGLIGHKAKDETRKEIVDTLTKLFDTEAAKMATRDLAVACLTAIGITPLPIDEAAMATPVDTKKGFQRPTEIKNRFDQVMWVMSQFDNEQGVNFLVRAHAPITAARLLADLPAGPGSDNLRSLVAKRLLQDITKLSKAKQEIQQSCVIALGQIGDCDDQELDKEIRAGLMAAREDLASNVMAKNFAVIALAQAASRPGSGANPMAGLDPKFKANENARKYLQETFAKAKGIYRPWVALAVGVLERGVQDNKYTSSTEMAVMIREALREAKQPSEVGAFAVALGIMKDSGGKEVLRDKLNNTSDDDAKGFAAVALGLIDDRDSIELIQGIIKKSKYRPNLLKSAAIGLGILGDKSVVPELVTMLDVASGMASQAAISSALGFIGDSRSIAPLITMLKDKQKTDNARGFAAVALGIVADKEELPWNTKISVNINYRANTSTLTSPDAGTGILDIL